MRATRNQGSFSTLVAIAGVALLAATGCDCGDNLPGDGTGMPDSAPDPDAPPPDAAIDAPFCATPDPAAIGGACSDTAACVANLGAAGFCLNDTLRVAWPVEGFCTLFCAEDVDCGEGNRCAFLPDDPNPPFGACMPDCCDGIGVGDSCEPGRLCSDSLFGDELMTESCVPGTRGAADGAPCTSFADCDKNSGCSDDRFQHPGGYCTTFKCESDDDCGSGGDGRCVDLPDEVEPICVDLCETDSDCREGAGYKCIDFGAPIGKYCAHPGPGDSCTVDLDCGLPDQPSPTEFWACRTGADYPSGYCTVEDCNPADNDTCPLFSFCVGLEGEADTFCADKCATVGGNECGTGYECIAVDIDGGAGVDTRQICVPTDGVVDEPDQG